MTSSYRRLQRRLLVVEVVTNLVAFLLAAAFAPRVLLLDPATSSASLSVIIVIGILSTALSAGFTVLIVSRVRSLLETLASDAPSADPEHVLELYDAPSRLALGNVAFVGGLSLVTLVPAFRPRAIDTYTQLALSLVVLTGVSTAALPAYALMRARVARTLERARPKVTEDALRRLGRGLFGRVRRRYVAAVALPVALIALGASLLADAHARAFDREARAQDAIDIAHAAFESLGTGRSEDIAGRAEAIEAAAALGFNVEILPGEIATSISKRGDETEMVVTVPLQPGVAAVRFETTRLSAAFLAYAALATLAVALAALLGSGAASFFEADLALATREIKSAGVAEVMRGTIILHEARFAAVADSLEAIDALGGIFREFASAQQRAIEAHAATERMRALLLASMSHDLKGPLNAVLGFTELVRRNQLTREQHESLAIIEQRGRELLVLIDTILDSARVEAGQLEVTPESAVVSDVVMSSVLEARDLSVGSDVEFVGEIQPDLPSLFADATRIAQALTAVALTAARFSGKGIVPVRATLPADGSARLRIEVETSGEGLPMAEREKIFDAFKSAESARRQGGLGLGLQLARSILEIHIGSIEVDATDHGGMVFRIWLPLKGSAETIRARAKQSSIIAPRT